MISRNYSEPVVKFQIPIIFSWEISSIEVILAWNLLLDCLHWKLNGQIGLPYFEVITSPVRSLKFMDFMVSILL